MNAPRDKSVVFSHLAVPAEALVGTRNPAAARDAEFAAVLGAAAREMAVQEAEALKAMTPANGAVEVPTPGSKTRKSVAPSALVTRASRPRTVTATLDPSLMLPQDRRRSYGRAMEEGLVAPLSPATADLLEALRSDALDRDSTAAPVLRRHAAVLSRLLSDEQHFGPRLSGQRETWDAFRTALLRVSKDESRSARNQLVVVVASLQDSLGQIAGKSSPEL